eukprot:ANDGO_05674.mRNA.1 Exosome complex exonuclease RRP44 homolog A
MSTSASYAIRNRKGRVTIVSKERHLRTDIDCQHVSCKSCRHLYALPVLGSSHVWIVGPKAIRAFVDGIALICDSLRLNQSDGFVRNSLSLVVPSSLLTRIRKVSGSRAAQKIRDLLLPPYLKDTESVSFGIVFPNDFCADTFVEEDDEIKRFVSLVAFYKRHLPDVSVHGLNDAADIDHFLLYVYGFFEDDVICRLSLMRESADSVFESSEDAFALQSGQEQSSDYYSTEYCETRVAEGQFARGTLEVSLSGRKSWVSGHAVRNPNRAVCGDVVFLDKESGDVKGIVQRSWRPLVVTLSQQTDSSVCIPLDRRFPSIELTVAPQTRITLRGQRLVARIVEWDAGAKFPRGIVVKVLGAINDLNAESEAVLVEHEVRLQDFSDVALSCIPKFIQDGAKSGKPFDFQFPESIVESRRDLRKSHFVFSVDPVSCTDIDDAMSVTRLENGNVEIGVHIADVSAILSEGSALDNEARQRAMTIYMIDRRMHMLPEILSSNACSLLENTDRLAVSVLWVLDGSTGRILESWHGRTIIRSRYALSYEQAQRMFESEDLSVFWTKFQPEKQIQSVEKYRYLNPDHVPAMKAAIRDLTVYASRFRQARMDNGALELNSLEEVSFKKIDTAEFVLESAEGRLEDDADLMHHVVAEWMIQTNCYVAQQLVSRNADLAFLRHHNPPDAEDLLELQRIAIVGLHADHFDVSSGQELSASLEAHSDPHGLLRALATRCMSEAQYICSGTTAKLEWPHYGLGVPLYTHFTSPIRRYADIVAHRLLLIPAASVHDTSTVANRRFYSELASYINDRHRRVKHIQSYATEWFRARYLARRVPADKVFPATVFAVSVSKLSVLVPEFRLKGDIVLDDATNFDSTSMSLRWNGSTYRLFSAVLVSLQVVDSLYHLPYVQIRLQGLDAEFPPRSGFQSRSKLSISSPMLSLKDFVAELRSPSVAESGEVLARRNSRRRKSTLYSVLDEMRVLSLSRLSCTTSVRPDEPESV